MDLLGHCKINPYLPPPPPPPPPPEYEPRINLETPPNSASCSTTPESKSNERLSSLSRSHPDLSKLDEELGAAFMRKAAVAASAVNGGHNSELMMTNTHQYYFTNCLSETRNGMVSLASHPQQQQQHHHHHHHQQQQSIVDILISDNNKLRAQLDVALRKVTKLEKLELEVQKVHQSHEDLMRSSEKKERLERAIRYKIDIELRRVQQQNKTLKEQLNATLATIAASKRISDDATDGSEMKTEIQKRDVLIAQLLSQNKELLNEKERQEIELQAQRLTLEEQRNHIETLDSALMSAQNNVVKLETDLRKRVCHEEKANNLQKALINLQLASDRRLKMEKRVRSHLEQEIGDLKKQLNGGKESPPDNKEVEELRKQVREYEEKIIQLESEVTKWEQKYLEENTMRHIEVDAASVPKDAKIAALERTSQESEKMILQARSERLKHMDELHTAHKRCAELEGKVRDQEAKLAEKDAMIKVLQQHSRDKDVVLQKSILAHRSAPFNHTRSASTMGLPQYHHPS